MTHWQFGDLSINPDMEKSDLGLPFLTSPICLNIEGKNSIVKPV